MSEFTLNKRIEGDIVIIETRWIFKQRWGRKNI